MLSCWEENPEKRPPFSTLRQDLDDFDTAIEGKYSHYEQPQYEKVQSRRKPQGKQGDRENKMAGRVRRKKQ